MCTPLSPSLCTPYQILYSPALNYNRKFRGKLPDFTLECRDDLDVRDKDAELKGLSKMLAGERRGARYTNVDVGDEVLVR